MEIKIIKCYRLEELEAEVQSDVINNFNESNYYWDVWKYERNKSFNAICECLDMTWQDSEGNYYVYPAYEVRQMQGAGRVIAYIMNHWNFKTVMYTPSIKKRRWYKAHETSLAKNRYEDWLPTGYSADYCLKEAFDSFVGKAKRNKKVSLLMFCECLAEAFTKEYQNDYEWFHSDAYVLEKCADNWYTEDGIEVTHLID